MDRRWYDCRLAYFFDARSVPRGDELRFSCFAGIHAREWISTATVLYIINELVENRDSLEKEFSDVDFHIVPLMNPDGYEYSHESERLWRKNRRRSFGAFCMGTDLNRNWAYEWGGPGSSKFPCQEIYAGTGPLSEPETKSVADYLLQNAAKFRVSSSTRCTRKLRFDRNRDRAG